MVFDPIGLISSNMNDYATHMFHVVMGELTIILVAYSCLRPINQHPSRSIQVKSVDAKG